MSLKGVTSPCLGDDIYLMGKNFIKIGRKSKRELNPVERYNQKLKDKKKLKGLIHKLGKRQDEPYQPKKRRQSSEPEDSNDPMLQQLITSRSLRQREEEVEAPKAPEIPDVPEEIEVVRPAVLVPISILTKTVHEADESSSSDSELPRVFKYDVAVPQPETLPKLPSQDYFRKLINRDDKLKEFYKRLGDLA